MVANTSGASRMKRTGRRLVQIAVGACAGAIVAAGACIPDLPPDQIAPSPAVDRGTCGDGYIDLAAGEECDPGLPDAGSPGCSKRCTVTCSGLRWPVNDHCYELMSASATSLQNGASPHCADFRGRGHVVTFASERERGAVSRYLIDAGAGSFWVGLWQDPQRFYSVQGYEPGWSPTCPGCYAHTLDPKAALPRSPETVADPTAFACVEEMPDSAKGSWLQYPCTGAPPLRVVCEHEPDGVHSTPCEAGICIELVATFGTKAYVYESLPMTWTDADTHCRSLGGTLVVLQSRDEREQLWLEISRLLVPPPRIWIGLSAAASPGDPDASVWLWDDGTNADAPDAYPPPWAIDQPSRRAPAFLSHESTLPTLDDTLAHTDPAVRALPSVCQIPAPGK
jgi:hypothetical protein